MIPEGYERETLSKEKQIILKWLDTMIDELENCKGNIDDFDKDICDENLLGKIKEEFAAGLIDWLKIYLNSYIDEVQITLAEDEGEEASDE